MKTITIKNQKSIFNENNGFLINGKTQHKGFINEQLTYNNQFNQRLLLEKKLQNESKAVFSSSIEVLKEFENINDDL